MASSAQVAANRANAQKSTGPRTAEGKALVAQNAVRHGLLAQRVVVKGEDPGAFALFRDRMREDLDPIGSVESLLADRIVNLAWRLGRAERLEVAAWDLLEAQQAARAKARASVLVRSEAGVTPSGQTPAEEAVLARVVVEDFSDDKTLDRLLGYERRIENSLYRTMGELRKQRLLSSEFRLQAGQKSQELSRERSQVASPPRLPTSHFTLEALAVEGHFGGTKPIDVGDLESGGPGGGTEETGRGRPGYEEPPYGITTNRAEPEARSGETKPIRGRRSEDRGFGDTTVEDTGRGRPGYEEPPDGVATNRAQPEARSGETKPIRGRRSEDRGFGDTTVEDTGRGRPGYEEAAADGAQQSHPPSYQDSRAPAGPAGETKPIEVPSGKFQVNEANRPGLRVFQLPTLYSTLPTRSVKRPAALKVGPSSFPRARPAGA